MKIRNVKLIHILPNTSVLSSDQTNLKVVKVKNCLMTIVWFHLMNISDTAVMKNAIPPLPVKRNMTGKKGTSGTR